MTGRHARLTPRAERRARRMRVAAVLSAIAATRELARSVSSSAGQPTPAGGAS